MRGWKHRRGLSPGGGRCRAQCALDGTPILSELQPGERAVINALRCNGNHRRRLLAIGMVPGREVTCVRGDGQAGMMCVRLGTSEFFINSSMADQIQIRRIS
jgi:Fe2+ transport system protein FeoA